MTWHPYDLTSIWFGNFIPRKFCFSGQNIVFNLDSSFTIAQLVCLQILKLYFWPTTEVHACNSYPKTYRLKQLHVYIHVQTYLEINKYTFYWKSRYQSIKKATSFTKGNVTVNNNQEFSSNQFMSWSVQWYMYCKRDNSVIQ